MQRYSSSNNTIEWDVWYNFRSKTQQYGSYIIRIDYLDIEKGEISFPRFWKPTTIKYYFDTYSPGEYSIELVVFDESYHPSNSTKFYDSHEKITIYVKKIVGLTSGYFFDISEILSATLIVIWFKEVKRKRLSRKKG